MTVEMDDANARLIFRHWQEYAEVADKFFCLGITPPPAFLPHPPSVLDQAINAVVRSSYEAGDRQIAKDIQAHAALHLGRYYTDGRTVCLISDAQALDNMLKTLLLMRDNPELKSICLKKLKDSAESWSNFKLNSKDRLR